MGQVSKDKKDVPNGIGRAIMDDNTIHEGLFQNGHLHGFGRSFFPDGTFYVGIYNKGKRHGEGRMTSWVPQEQRKKFVSGRLAKKKKKINHLHMKWAALDGQEYNIDNLSSEYESEVASDYYDAYWLLAENGESKLILSQPIQI